MRKRYTFLFLFVFQTIVVSAQLSFGLKGGLNVNASRVSNQPEMFGRNVESSLSFHFGAFMKAGISDKFYLLPEIQYARKGFNESYSSNSVEVRYVLTYMELPVMLGYAPVQWLGIELGPSVGLNVGAKRITDVATQDIKDIIESLELGLTGGVRANLSSRVSVSARYFYGLTQTQQMYWVENNATTDMMIRWYNRNIYCSLYYVLR